MRLPRISIVSSATSAIGFFPWIVSIIFAGMRIDRATYTAMGLPSACFASLNASTSPPFPHDARSSSEESEQLASSTLKSPTFERSMPVRSTLDGVNARDAVAPPPSFCLIASHDTSAAGTRRRARADAKRRARRSNRFMGQSDRSPPGCERWSVQWKNSAPRSATPSGDSELRAVHPPRDVHRVVLVGASDDHREALQNGNVSYLVNKVGRGRAKHRVMEPVEFLVRIAALVPPRGFRWVASRACWRRAPSGATSWCRAGRRLRTGQHREDSRKPRPTSSSTARRLNHVASLLAR